MMNRKQLGRMYSETYGVTYQTGEQLIKQVFDLLGTAIFEYGENVTISGFGSFKHKLTKFKRIRHPKTGEIITKPIKESVKFLPSESLNEPH